MNFAALGYEGDPMIVGERFMSEEEIEEIESMDAETTESETETSESSPGFELFVGVFGLIAAVLILRHK
jgi:PGF-CTERM protein